MNKIIFAITVPALAALALAVAPSASADTDSIASWGNENLGGSLGVNGGSVSVGGVTTTVDGINTLDGQLQVKGYGYSSTVDQHYGAFGVGSVDGLETEWTVVTPQGTHEAEGYLYYTPPKFATFEASGPGYTSEFVCDPLCHPVN